jgi:NitT/TauT family transport system substrate-binding protein
MGSSGDRARALLAGRVDAVPMHVEQARQIATRGNFPILVRPWLEYDDWFSAVIVARQAWLDEDENKEAAVALLKSTLTAFRKTDADYAWYKARVADYASSKELKAAPDDFLKPVWKTLITEVKAFPPQMEPMTPEQFAKTLPVYKENGALKGTVNLHKVIDRRYLEQAIKELG